jgi:hypothetical protein
MVLTKTNLGSIPYARLFTALSFASLILWEFDTVTKESGRKTSGKQDIASCPGSKQNWE